ncbi:uncharacterized protein C1orf198 homolog [Ornithorhynchus anatinus]|uniref:Chromosome 1 open reading frame 198 n=1 Tax=Ornithorhynchus anatinus TaxID=9258 RepID=A0A6I8N952_ORNAN|nr:uncharacterized protein C1orf198 homolog [Ornithorhynchus anatinus]
MASMAAAIAASRTAALSGNRPLDDKERKRFTYFSSLSPMARKIMQDKERIRQRYGPDWERLPARRQDELIDRGLVEPHVQARYAAHCAAPSAAAPAATGQKVVHFGDEDLTWQDEHSAPFSWETKSQMEFSIASLSIQEPSGSLTQTDPRPAAKPTVGGKTPGADGPGAPRKEEESSSFWKISAERSRVEGTQAELPSLTPSQIKSLEKGEKGLTPYLRPEPAPWDREPARAERLGAPRQERTLLPGLGSERERAWPGPASPTKAGDSWLPEPAHVPASTASRQDGAGSDDAASDSAGGDVFESVSVQPNPSKVLLKTGFDFLDNW